MTGKLWHPLTIKRMVMNQTYTGETYFGKTRRVTQDGKLLRLEDRPQSDWIAVLGATPPIVSTEEFNRAQVALNGPRQRLVSPPANYLLRGHARCGLCGGPMTGITLSRKYRYYQCTNARKMAGRPAKCDARYVKADPLEESVLAEVKRLLEDPNVVISEVKHRQSVASPFGEVGLRRVEKEMDRLSRQGRRLVRLFRFGDINEQYVEEEIRDIRRRQAVLVQEKQELEKHRELMATLEAAEVDIEQICASVHENLEGLSYDGQCLEIEISSTKCNYCGNLYTQNTRFEYHVAAIRPGGHRNLSKGWSP